MMGQHVYGCKTEDSTKGKCATCNDGYTLSTDKTSCETKKEDDKSSSFGLYTSLLIFALGLLF